MAGSNVMTLAVKGLDIFARKITHDGMEYKVLACSVNDVFEELDRVKSLLKDLVCNHLENDVINEIGLSNEDLLNLGFSSEEGIINDKIPPRTEWYGE